MARMTEGQASFNSTFQSQLDAISKELGEVRDVIYGRPQAGWQGVVVRVEETEKRVGSMKEVQESFIRDQQREKEEQLKRDRVRNRLYTFALTLIAGILTGIVVQLFILIAGGGVT